MVSFKHVDSYFFIDMYNAIDFCILIHINSSNLPVELYFLYT